MQEKDWWDCIVEKMKIVNRVSPTSPVPMDMFHPATRLVKQGKGVLIRISGSLIRIKGKEVQLVLYI